MPNYYRVYSAAQREGPSANRGPMTVLSEIDDDGVILRRLHFFERAPWVKRFTDRPVHVEAAQRYEQLTERVADLGALDGHRITGPEFEYTWETGLLRVPSYEDLKWELLLDASEDIAGMFAVLQMATGFYPHWFVSDRMAIAERALRDLPACSWIELRTEDQETVIPSEQCDDVLRRVGTWVVLRDGHVEAWFVATPKGIAAAQDAGKLRKP